MRCDIIVAVLCVAVCCAAAEGEAEDAGAVVLGEGPAAAVASGSAWDFPGGNDALYDLALASLLSAAPPAEDGGDSAETAEPPKKRFIAFLTPRQTLRAMFRQVHRLDKPLPETVTPPTASPSPLHPGRLDTVIGTLPAFSGKRRTRLASYVRFT